ncbi:MAG: glycerol-3-phosphate 1-O-acyltransferase PlsY [Rhodospirillaceae bacterium]|nr:glycerol-3-phosphate 1-O-acyltransferase PlsY [Rhodospirillaceae bacterium]
MPDPMGDLNYTWPFLAAAALGYLLGSVPFGLVLTKLAGHGDIRQIGSGNIGATNVLRTGSKGLAALTVLLDGGKGAAAFWVAGLLGPDMAVLAGGGAFLGHLFPVSLKFRGGKGVATALGILIAACWEAGLLACLTWLAVAAAFRYSSLAALVSLAVAPAYMWYLADLQRTELAAFLAILVFVRHHTNIRRLLKRKESRIKLKP